MRLTGINISLSASTRYGLGLGALWAWGAILHHSDTILVSEGQTERLDILWLCLIGVGILFFIIAALRHRRITESFMERKNALTVFAALASLATAAMPLAASLPFADFAIGTISEVGTCLLFLAWGCAIFSLKGSEINRALIKTAVAHAAIALASHLVFDLIAYIIDFLLPLVSALLLPSDYPRKMKSARIRFPPPKTILSSFRGYFLVVASFGMAFGFLRTSLLNGFGSNEGSASLVYFMGFGIGATALMLTKSFSSTVDETTLFKATLPLTVLGLFLLALPKLTLGIGGPLFIGCGDIWFDTIKWILIALAIKRMKVSPTLCFSLLLGISWIGVFAGFLLGTLSSRGLADPLIGLAIIVLCLVTSGVMMFGRIGILSLEFSPEQAEQAPVAQNSAPKTSLQPNATHEDLFRQFGLTPRECEIAEYLLAGRTRGYIEEKLVLSKSTVKTHVRHIYEKTGVHSQQELLSLAEEIRASR